MFGWFKSKPAAPQKPTPEQAMAAVEKILDAYGELVETRPFVNEVIDEKELPYPKDTILTAICIGLVSDGYDEGGLIVCATGLAQFQPGVGLKRLHALGFDPRAMAGMDPELLVQKITGDPAARERYESFQPAIERDRQMIEARIAKAQSGQGVS